MKDITIIGGGLAGLVNAIVLGRAGFSVLVIEKRNYPFHKVCGEYISNETLPFLKSIGADPSLFNPAQINNLLITGAGTEFNGRLDLGGWGLSRFALDNFLYEMACAAGVEFWLNEQVKEVTEEDNTYSITTSSMRIVTSRLVIGAYGKRSVLDRKLERSFFYKRSPYIGVKYHIKCDFKKDVIALHIFKQGYCGISKIEEDKYCLCYLSSRSNLDGYANVREMEEDILYKNAYLKELFTNSDFLYEKPEVINEVSFEQKSLSEKGIFMCGDSAGMIAPLCGNGMSMAIHSAKLLSEAIIDNYKQDRFNHSLIERQYAHEWRRFFERRLTTGRWIQQLFLRELVAQLSIKTIRSSGRLANWVIKKTHGKPF